ncbi:hypothetical protein [Vreelandella venusta]|uniref:hypothetical protein n=1 Tax=Vreelandella venusta TaxID=44935 RepID=UPI003F666BB3
MNPRHEEMEAVLLKHDGKPFSFRDTDPDADLYYEMEKEGALRITRAMNAHLVHFTDGGREALATLKGQ